MRLRHAHRSVLPACVALVLGAAGTAGCNFDGQTPRNPGPQGTDTTVTLAPGTEVFPLGQLLRLSFVAVPSDSRCPLGVFCISEGNAVVRVGLGFGMGPTGLVDLNTTVEPHDTIFGSYRVTVVGLTPLRTFTDTIPPSSYRATLHIQRFGPD